MTLLAFTSMGLWSLELLWKGRKEAQTFDIFYLQMSYTSSQLISQVPSCSIASLKKFNYFPWVQYFIQISGGILFSPEEKIFVWKLWVLVGSKCRFKFFSLYLLFFFFCCFAKCCFYIGGEDRLWNTRKIVALCNFWNLFGTSASLRAFEMSKTNCSSW